MYSSKSPLDTRAGFLAGLALVFMIAAISAIGVMLEQPQGSIYGHIALEQENFGLSSYNIRASKVYATATGPRFTNNSQGANTQPAKTITRGVWVNGDGTFQLDQLPVGEYSVRIRAPGFETEYIESVFVTEAKVAKLTDPLKLRVLQPSISIASNMRVFTSKEEPHFWINATGASEAKVKVYKKDFMEIVKSKALQKEEVQVGADCSLYVTYNSKFHNPWNDETPVYTAKRELVANYTDQASAHFKMDKALPYGDYFVIAEAADFTGTKHCASVSWFSVTDLGLIVKQAPEQTLVRAINLQTMAPVSNVNVEVMTNTEGNLTKITNSKTGANGVVMMNLKDGAVGEGNLLVRGNIANQNALAGNGYWSGGTRDMTTYFYTDRPVYRLGQTVNFKGLARKNSTHGFVNPGKGQAVSISIEDPNNEPLYSGQLTTTAHGTYNGTYKIPEEGKTGAYQIKLTYGDDSTSYQAFEVVQYRKPEYQVEIIPGTPRVSQGEKVKAKVRATYYFGAPVSNAQIKYSIYSNPDSSIRYSLEPRPDYYQYFDDWEEGNYREDDYDYGGLFVAEGKAVTNKDGEAEIEFAAPAHTVSDTSPYSLWDYNERNLKIHADVTDISRMTVSSDKNVLATAGDFTLFVNPKKYVVTPNENMESELLALDYDGKPVANQTINVRLSRWPYDHAKHQTMPEQTFAKQTVTTDASGKANVSFKVEGAWPSDTFYVLAEAKDKRGHSIVYGNSFWIANSSEPYTQSAQDLFKVVADKKVYKVGETAKIMISGPFSAKDKCEALVTVEGMSIFDYKLVSCSGNAAMVEIPIKDEHAPNIYFGCNIVTAKKQMFDKEIMLMVSPDNHFVDLKVTTDKEKYKPGETATYKIKATKTNGTPAQNIELSLGVVDESIYAIRGDATQDIRKFFYYKRANNVQSFSSFPEQYSGGPDKIEPRMRKNFKDTAAWLPNLITDKNGEVTAKVPLPDNLTTWRATVRGISSGTDIGSTTQKILVTQDIIARLALPRFFTTGDQGEITGIVHNYSGKDQSVKMTLVSNGQFDFNQPLTQTINVPKDGVARFIWNCTAKRSGNAVLQLKAVCSTGGDALEKTLPINAFAINMFKTITGILTDEKPNVTLPFEIPQGASDPNITVSLAASSIGQIKGGFSSLIDYPYGCTEQTTSKLMPSIVAYQMHQKLGVPLEAADLKKFEVVKKLALARLKDYQHSDGAWGWWKEDNSDVSLTCYVLEALKLMNQSGNLPNAEYKQMTDPAIKWLGTSMQTLQTQLSDPKLVKDYMARERTCDMARAAYVMSLYNQKPKAEVMNWLLKMAGEHTPLYTPEPLSYLTMAFDNFGEKAKAKTVYDRLVTLANIADGTVDWEHTPAMLKKINTTKDGGLGYDYTYRYTGVESTALALRAMLQLEPTGDKVEAVKQWLLVHRDKSGWANTKTTAEVLLAFLKDALVNPPTLAYESASVQVLLNEAMKDTATFTAQDLFNTEKSFLYKGTQKVSLNKSGSGKLYYNSFLSYLRNLKPTDNIAGESQPKGLQIKREFMRLEPAATTSDGVLHLKSVPVTGDLKAGELLLMKISIETPISLPYVIVESPLPSGAEVVENKGMESAAEEDTNNQAAVQGDWGNPWWTHQDVLDDRMVFFGTTVPAGKSQFHTLLRMELPGKVNLKPVQLEGMYTNLIRGYSQPGSLSIKD